MEERHDSPPRDEDSPEGGSTGHPRVSALWQYRSDLVAALTHMMGVWAGADFIADVARSEGIDLDHQSIIAITLLARGGPRRPSSLAQELTTGASNVSKITRRLEDEGVAERIPDPDDARANLLRLTAHGNDIARSLVRAGDRLITELIGDWSAEDAATFTRLMMRFDAASTAYAERSL